MFVFFLAKLAQSTLFDRRGNPTFLRMADLGSRLCILVLASAMLCYHNTERKRTCRIQQRAGQSQPSSQAHKVVRGSETPEIGRVLVS